MEASRCRRCALLSLNGLALLAFGVLPQPLLGLCVVALANSRLL
jgi:hypothetical protein